MSAPVASTMQDAPLSLATLVRYGSTVYGDTCVSAYDGNAVHTQTLAELAGVAAQLANALVTDLGIEPGTVIGTLMWNTMEHFVAYLAVPASGSILHTVNARYSNDQIAQTVNHAGDRVLIVDATLFDRCAEVLPQLESVQHVVVVGETGNTAALSHPGVQVHQWSTLLADKASEFDWPELPEQTPAAMCYTSGTTGDPKAVVYSHRSIYLATMQMCMGDYLGLSVRDRALAIAPMFHVNSWNFPFATLMVGTALILPGRFVQPEHLLRLIDECHPTVSAGVPTVWSDLLRHARTHGADLSSLREVIVGGSACPRALMEAYQAEFGVRLIHGWGMTEMSPFGSIAKADKPHDAGTWTERMSQGRLLCGVQARVVGPDGHLLPNDGASLGEIETRGPWVTGAYWGISDASAFHDGWLRTGDVGTISARGILTLSDRTKDIIKSGGEWISSIALEALLQGHPDVAEAAVVGVPDERWGERPWAVVVAPDRLHFRSLADYLAAHIDRWQIPERWTQLDALPRTSVGKPDKSALRALYSAGVDVADLRDGDSLE